MQTTSLRRSLAFPADIGKVSAIRATVKQNLKLGNGKQRNSFLDFKNKSVHLQVNTFPCFGISNYLKKIKDRNFKLTFAFTKTFC
jgi:hypothetical protein